MGVATAVAPEQNTTLHEVTVTLAEAGDAAIDALTDALNHNVALQSTSLQRARQERVLSRRIGRR